MGFSQALSCSVLEVLQIFSWVHVKFVSLALLFAIFLQWVLWVLFNFAYFVVLRLSFWF